MIIDIIHIDEYLYEESFFYQDQWMYSNMSIFLRKHIDKLKYVYMIPINDWGNTFKKEVMDMKRFMIPRVAHCAEGCLALSWA